MSQPKRYFVNPVPDYAGGEVKVSQEAMKRRCLTYLKTVFSKQGTSFKDCDGGLYVGIAGVAYMCYYLAQQPTFQDEKQDLLNRSEEYMKQALAYVNHPNIKSDATMQPSFFLGAGGVYAVAAALCDLLGRIGERDSFLEQYAALSNICLAKNFLRCGSDELFVGRAGYLCGLLFLLKSVGIQVLTKDQVSAVCQTIVDSGREYSMRRNSPCPLMYAYYGTEYLGAAHGLSSILQMLLSFPEYLDANSEAEKHVKDSVDFMLSLQTPEGNFPCAMDEIAHRRPEKDELVHWCHGAPGVVYLMAKAYQRWNDERYLQACLACGEIVWKKGLLRKGPGICHGVAGSGYVFLLLYRLTSDPRHLHRALGFSDFLFSEKFRQARTPDSPYSLFEGLAGTVCFLADLMHPEKAAFPFFDVL